LDRADFLHHKANIPRDIKVSVIMLAAHSEAPFHNQRNGGKAVFM
jgi:hypothetical protein